MRVLFDQGTPVPLRNALPGHEVSTAYELGWSTLKNGELLRMAEERGFEVLVGVGHAGSASSFASDDAMAPHDRATPAPAPAVR